MNLLIVGDLHLGLVNGEPHAPSSLSRFDAVLLVGDLTDRGRTAAADGFLNALDARSPPVYVVPGNHDQTVYAKLLGDYDTVYDIHRQRQTLPDGSPVIGVGSRTFDEGPEVRTPVPGDDETPRWRRVHRRVRRDSDNSIPPGQRDWYCRRYARLLWLTDECVGSPVVVSHPPPYGTQLDRMHSRHGRGKRSWGSMALRKLLAATDVRFLACGHVHEAAGNERINGTLVLNAGFRTNWHVQLSDGVEIVEKVPFDDN